MKDIDRSNDEETAVSIEATDADQLLPLVLGRNTNPAASHSSSRAVVGELIGMRDEGRTPLVLYPGQPGSAAVPARSVIDVQGAHIGKQVVLMLDDADAGPIIMGVLREDEGWPLHDKPGHVEVDVDGDRVVVSGKRQVVLRCGKASITLTNDGKVLIQGTYVSSHSSGVNRIKGGSVQIN